MSTSVPIWFASLAAGVLAVLSSVAGNWVAQADRNLVIPGKPDSVANLASQDEWLVIWQGKADPRDIFIVLTDGQTVIRLLNVNVGLTIRPTQVQDNFRLDAVAKSPAGETQAVTLATGTLDYCKACLQAIADATKDPSVTFCWLNEVPQ